MYVITAVRGDETVAAAANVPQAPNISGMYGWVCAASGDGPVLLDDTIVIKEEFKYRYSALRAAKAALKNGFNNITIRNNHG